MAYYEKRSKNTYKLVVSLGYDANGKHRRISKTIKLPDNMTQNKREKELNAMCVLFEKEVNEGLYLEGEKINFEELNLGLVASQSKCMKDYCEQLILGVEAERYLLMPFYCANENDVWFLYLKELAKQEKVRHHQLQQYRCHCRHYRYPLHPPRFQARQ